MNNALAQKFTFWKLIRFAMPTAIMMVFLSLYTIVDGIFISRFVGTDALSATNIVFPVITIVMAIGVMLSTGSTAIIARKMGEGKLQEANQNFTLIVLVTIGLSIFLGSFGYLFRKPLITLLGSNAVLFPYCEDYLKYMLMFLTPFMLQILFQPIFVAAGNPHLGLGLTVIAGILNIILDYLFMGVMHLGIKGAAFGTVSGYCITSIVGMIYFFVCRKTLYFVKPTFSLKMLLEACINGSSEMVTNLANSVITFLFNMVMMRLLGEDGVAAITIILYAQFLFTSLYVGFCNGVAPVISYNYGSQNNKQLKRLFNFCLIFFGISSIMIFFGSLICAKPIVHIFTPTTSNTFAIALKGFKLFAWSYLFTGANIFTSAFFTALSNGKISAIISFLRTFVFIIIGIMIFPALLGVTGVWIAVPIAELCTLAVSAYLLISQNKTYHYLTLKEHKEKALTRN